MKFTTYSGFTQSQLEVLRDSLDNQMKTLRKKYGTTSHEVCFDTYAEYRVTARLWSEVINELDKRNQ